MTLNEGILLLLLSPELIVIDIENKRITGKSRTFFHAVNYVVYFMLLNHGRTCKSLKTTRWSDRPSHLKGNCPNPNMECWTNLRRPYVSFEVNVCISTSYKDFFCQVRNLSCSSAVCFKNGVLNPLVTEFFFRRFFFFIILKISKVQTR